MFPIITKNQYLQINSYGLILCISYIITLSMAIYRAKKNRISPVVIAKLGIILAISTIFGAWIFDLLISPNGSLSQEVSNRLVFLLNGWVSGFAITGGMFFSIPLGLIFLKMDKQNVGIVANLITPCGSLLLGLGRLACFAAGCCHGKPTSLPVGIVFPKFSHAWRIYGSVPVHPTQLYLSTLGFLLFGLLLYLERKIDKPWVLFFIFFMLYSMGRFFIEFLRYYHPLKYINFMLINLK